MSWIGFDIGNESCVIAVAKQDGNTTVLSETPAIVSFGERQRLFGSAGAASSIVNLHSTISNVKRLIGRQYKEASVQKDLSLLHFKTSEGPRGGVLIHLHYLKKKWIFMPLEILGMLFAHLKKITEKNLASPIEDCVIGIPSYFTDLQRREYLAAASIAGLRPLRLMHDCTAFALSYRMYKTDLPNSRPTNVVFVDIGHCDTQVSVATFEEKVDLLSDGQAMKQDKIKILSHSFDPNLGGRDFDEVLFKHFAAQFKERYNINVYTNKRSSIRLRVSCEKLKKVLSTDAQAPLTIKRLLNDTDVEGFITREEFERLSMELLERITLPCIKAVKDSGLSVDKIDTIELAGSGSRIPIITKKLASIFWKEPRRTSNPSEHVAQGCALQCALLHPNQLAKNYEVQDSFPYSILLPLPFQNQIRKFPFRIAKNLFLKAKDPFEIDAPSPCDQGKSMLFSKCRPIPCYETVRCTNQNIHFEVSYTNTMDFPTGVSPIVGHFSLGSCSKTSDEKRVEVEFKLNEHGIVEIKSASIFWYDENNPFSPKRIANPPFSQNLDVTITKDELHEAQERERMLAEHDTKVKQTKDQRNTLQTFVYDAGRKLRSVYGSIASDLEKEGIIKCLQETQDWLYGDHDVESEEDYADKLEDLFKLLDPIENRYNDEYVRAQTSRASESNEEYCSVAGSLPFSKKDKVHALEKKGQQKQSQEEESFAHKKAMGEEKLGKQFERLTK